MQWDEICLFECALRPAQMVVGKHRLIRLHGIRSLGDRKNKKVKIMSTTLYVFAEKNVTGEWVMVRTPHDDGSRRSAWEIPNWAENRCDSCRWVAAVLTGLGSDDIPGIAGEVRPVKDASPEVALVARYHEDFCGLPHVAPLAALKDYDFDQKANVVARTYSPAELAELRWRGNGDGTPYTDMQSHRRSDIVEPLRKNGYRDTLVPVRRLVSGLLTLAANIEAAAQTSAHNVRLLIWGDW